MSVVTTEGFAVGTRVGTKLGLADPIGAEGLAVGKRLGTKLGLLVPTTGFPVGAAEEGFIVGTCVGMAEGTMGHVFKVARKAAPF